MRIILSENLMAAATPLPSLPTALRAEIAAGKGLRKPPRVSPSEKKADSNSSVPESKHACRIPSHCATGITVSGTSHGARFKLAEPLPRTGEKGGWNGAVLLYAHGFRPVGHGLQVELDMKQGVYARLVAEGWIVAATSYRREGVILHDAMVRHSLAPPVLSPKPH
jgi:hypothetical protein